MTPFEDNTQYLEDLRSLILECELTIQNIESRLESPTHGDQERVVRTQLEFTALNIRGMKMEREQQLRGMEQFNKRMIKYPPLPSPSSPAAPYSNLLPHPSINLDDVSRQRMYINKRNPQIGNVVYLMKDDRLLDPITGQEWLATEDWILYE